MGFYFNEAKAKKLMESSSNMLLTDSVLSGIREQLMGVEAKAWRLVFNQEPAGEEVAYQKALALELMLYAMYLVRPRGQPKTVQEIVQQQEIDEKLRIAHFNCIELINYLRRQLVKGYEVQKVDKWIDTLCAHFYNDFDFQELAADLRLIELNANNELYRRLRADLVI